MNVFADGVTGPVEPPTIAVAERRDREGVMLRLPAQGAVRGTVVDDRGEPVGGAIVVAEGDSASSRATATASDGQFILRGLLPGAYRLHADFRGLPAEPTATAEVAVQIVANGVAGASLTIPRARGQIGGRVVDLDGEPVTDAFVAAVGESGDAEADTRTRLRTGGEHGRVMTDSDGSFVIGGLAPGRYALRAHRSGGEAFVEHVALGAELTLTIQPLVQRDAAVAP